MNKREIRKQVLRKRDLISEKEKKAKDNSIRSTVLNLPEFRRAKKVLFYASYKSEVDTFVLIKDSISINKAVALPKVNNSVLDIYEIKDLDELHSGYQNIPEPLLPSDRILQVSDLDLIIVPGVAFDTNCNRLGYGKGFYDKLLNEKLCPAIALAYEEQIVDIVPTESHDVKMDKIITEKRIIVKNGS